MSHRTRNRTVAALLAVAACTGAGAQTAAADTVTRTDYSVEVTGTGYYNRASVKPSPVGELVHQEDEEFRFRTEFPTVSFFGQQGTAPEKSLGKAEGVRAKVLVQAPKGVALDCGGSTVTDYVAGRMTPEPGAGVRAFKLRIFESLSTQMECNLGVGTYPKRYESTGEVGSGAWDTRFDMPSNAVGQDQITVPISGGRSGQACPGWDAYTTICELSFTGSVVFRKTGWEDLPGDSDDLVVPLVRDPDPTPPADPAAKPVVEAVTTAAKLTRGAVSVPVSCPAGCSGTATVTLAGGKARAAAAKSLARKRFTVAPGATKRISVAIPKRSRNAVRRAGGVRLTLDVTPTGGVRTTKRLTVRLKRA